jgi:death on curing protein
LESTLAQPQAQFGGSFLHHDLYEMAAAYLFHIVMNHPFVDGNKRTGLDAATTFLRVNGVQVDSPDAELYQLVIDVTQSSSKKPEIAEFFCTHAAG